MDIISHIVTANLAGSILNYKNPKIRKLPLLVGGVIPDLGEIMIQVNLSRKFGSTFGVYDLRTSDISVASQLSTTWLYDILHSPILVVFCLLTTTLGSNKITYSIKSFAFGLLIHIFLDLFTHGNVWAMKLFFPISNQRSPIFADTIGNWWDWTPKFSLPFVSYGFPVLNIAFIFIILSFTIYFQKCQQK